MEKNKTSILSGLIDVSLVNDEITSLNGARDVDNKMIAAINGSIQYVSIVTFPILKWGMNIIEAITPIKAKTEITIVATIRENYVLIFI